jgi:hypothetical protein
MFNQYMEIPVNPSKARYCWETPSTMLQISCSNGLATDPAVPLIQAVLEMSQHLRRTAGHLWLRDWPSQAWKKKPAAT